MKRLLPLVLVVVLLAGLVLPASAATPKVETTTTAAFGFAFYQGNAAVDPERTVTGDEIIIPLLKPGFKDADGADITWSTKAGDEDLGPTVAQLASNGIKPKIYVSRGTAVIRDIEIVKFTPKPNIRAQSAIRIRFVEDLVSTSEVQYEFTIALSHRNKITEMGDTFGGMISNPIVEIFNHDYVYIGDGEIAKCEVSTDSIRVDIGNGLSLYSDMLKGQKYYGIARQDANDGQNVLLAEHKEIVEVYNLQTINLKTHGDVIEFTELAKDKQEYYIYNRLGQYIGTSRDRLPYSTRYYVSTELIEIDIDPTTLDDHEDREEFPISSALAAFMQGGIVTE